MIQISLSHYQLNLMDITQRIENEQQIADQLENCRQLHGSTHEIRRPLTNIMGAYDLIQAETDEEKKQQHLDTLYQSAKELNHVIHHIVDHTT